MTIMHYTIYYEPRHSRQSKSISFLDRGSFGLFHLIPRLLTVKRTNCYSKINLTVSLYMRYSVNNGYFLLFKFTYRKLSYLCSLCAN